MRNTVPYSYYKNKNILISGGLGFVGSNLARALTKFGAKIHIIDSLTSDGGGNFSNISGIEDLVEVTVSDIRDLDVMSRLLGSVDVYFNLAGQTSHVGSMLNPKEDLEVNVTAQLEMLQICRDVNPDIRVVFASTRQIYGKPDYLPVDEEHPIRPPDVNGINKYAAETYHLLYNKVHELKTCVLRLTNTYGEGMRVKDAKQTFLGIWIKSILEGLPINVFGDGMQLRDFNYIDDVVNAFIIAGSNPLAYGMVFNLGSPEVVSLNKLAEIMINTGYGGRYQNVEFPPQRKAIDIGDYYANIDKICDKLNWIPKTSLQAGLKKTLDYYNINLKNYL